MMEIMQGKQAMMQAHMVKMEAHLANIEALLQQLVNAQAMREEYSHCSFDVPRDYMLKTQIHTDHNAVLTIGFREQQGDPQHPPAPKRRPGLLTIVLVVHCIPYFTKTILPVNRSWPTSTR